MTTLIKNRRITQDDWLVLGAPAGELDTLPATGNAIVPLAQWIAQRDALLARSGKVGVWLGPADDVEQLVAAGPLPELVAVHFPAFTDGRGYSTARLLRERYGFKGELRAIGDVLRDELFELARCGFDAFALRADQDAETCLKAFDDFSEVYQAAVDRGPLFARRFAAPGKHDYEGHR